MLFLKWLGRSCVLVWHTMTFHPECARCPGGVLLDVHATDLRVLKPWLQVGAI
jgi:hypothetical protein